MERKKAKEKDVGPEDGEAGGAGEGDDEDANADKGLEVAEMVGEDEADRIWRRGRCRRLASGSAEAGKRGAGGRQVR